METPLSDLPCGEKLPFATQAEAEAAAVYAAHRYGGRKPQAYRCRSCERWHLSSAQQTD